MIGGGPVSPPAPHTDQRLPEDILDENDRNYAITSVLADAALRRALNWQDVAYALDALESYDATREALVDEAARERLAFYRAVGGTQLTLDDFRARCRVALATGEWL